MRIELGIVAILALGLFACDAGTEEEGAGGAGGTSACETAEYVAFDPTNHAAQDLRLQQVDDMLAQFAIAQADPAQSGAAADAILAIYESEEGKLAEKVLGRTDMHFEGAAAEVGPQLDTVIRAAILELREATDAQTVKLAKQRFEKAGFYRFYYLSVLHELAEPSEKHFDEAFGYFGSGATNAESGRKGLSRLATKRDGTNGTTLADETFALITEGRCVLAAAVAEHGEQLTLDTDPAYRAIVDAIDAKLQLAIAYSIGHELFELDAERDDVASAQVKVVEAWGFLEVIAPYLTGTRAELLTNLNAAIDEALEAMAAGEDGWVSTFPALELIEQLETVFAIDIKG